MSELDKTLKAIVDLCPENIPEIESLPIPELKIGDQCLLVWSDQMDFWRVKSFCANDGVDIVDDKFNAHMEVPRNELRLASDLLNARQSEINQLKTQLNNMEACYIEKKKRVDEALTWLTRTDIRAISMAREILQGGDLKALRGAND